MSPTQSKALAAVFVLAALTTLFSAGACWAQQAPPCQPTNVVIDAAPPDTVLEAFNGRGQGQVILVADTLVSEITFEMPAYPGINFSYGILYVMDVDVNGRPIVSEAPVYTSQLIPSPQGTGLDPVPLVFTFDPPMVLPRLGRYFFDVNEAVCLGVIRLLGDTTNRYSYGGTWPTGQSGCDGRGPGSPTVNDPQLDLICDISYCDLATPVMRKTWGSLKVIYR
jgi:hypothetical protein